MQIREGIEEPKIISQKILDDKLFISCEIFPNKMYGFELINGNMIKSVIGADLIEDTLQFFIPGDKNISISHEIIIQMI
jgi:hypothetical protein